MDVAALKRHCRALPGSVETLHGEPSNILVYEVGGKRFAYFKTSEPERWRFSFKVAPERFLELTDQPGIIPAPYMARSRWISVTEPQRFGTDELAALILDAYVLVRAKLTKKLQATLGPIPTLKAARK